MVAGVSGPLWLSYLGRRFCSGIRRCLGWVSVLGEVADGVLKYGDGLFLDLRHSHPAGLQSIAAYVGFDQAGIHVHLRRQQPHAQQLVVQTVEDCREAIPGNPINETPDAGMVENRIANGEKTKPAISEILGNGRAQSAKGRDVVQRSDE